MAFGGNTTPKKKKLPAGKPWICGCKVSVPAYIGFCGRCGKGQPKP